MWSSTQWVKTYKREILAIKFDTQQCLLSNHNLSKSTVLKRTCPGDDKTENRRSIEINDALLVIPIKCKSVCTTWKLHWLGSKAKMGCCESPFSTLSFFSPNGRDLCCFQSQLSTLTPRQWMNCTQRDAIRSSNGCTIHKMVTVLYLW